MSDEALYQQVKPAYNINSRVTNHKASVVHSFRHVQSIQPIPNADRIIRLPLSR